MVVDNYRRDRGYRLRVNNMPFSTYATSHRIEFLGSIVLSSSVLSRENRRGQKLRSGDTPMLPLKPMELDYERFPSIKWFLLAPEFSWWPKHLIMDGIPPMDRRETGNEPTFLTLPKDKCKNVNLPILVKSAPKNVEKRKLIRKIFDLQNVPGSKLFFVFGNTNSGSRLRKKITV